VNVIVQQLHAPLRGVSMQQALRPVHICNEVFDSNIELIASFVIALDKSSNYELIGLSFFVILSILV